MIMHLGLVLVVIVTSGTYILLSLRSSEFDKSRLQLELYAEKINEQVIQSTTELQFQDALLRTVPNAVGIQGNILNHYGSTLASTTVLERPMPTFTDQAIIGALLNHPTFVLGEKNIDSFGLLTEWMSYATPVYSQDNELKYVIYTRLDVGDMQNSLDKTASTIVFALSIALILALIMAYIFSQSLTVPIVALTKGAKKLAEGNLNENLLVHSQDEIGQLTMSFNYMATELTNSLKEISAEKQKLEILLHNMSDGVISFTKDGDFILANSATCGILGYNIEDFNMNFSEFIKTFNIVDNSTNDDNPETSKKIGFYINEQFINSNFTPYYNSTGELEGLVVVLQDITEQKKLDDMRKEFVANVSHELRTPLTNIKSYTETLIDGAFADEEICVDFLEIINSEADRMAFLVKDLLELSRFDNKQILLDISEIELNNFLQSLVKQNSIQSHNKNQTLIFNPYNKPAIVYGDQDRLSQVASNIVTNAIKYSLEGATITVSIEEDSLYFKVIVKDTGMGISKEDLPRIFERFYRVDKARSRAMGGTGLGLAIAKEIMEGHYGKLTAESVYKKGTTMTMWLLKDPPFENGLELNNTTKRNNSTNNKKATSSHSFTSTSNINNNFNKKETSNIENYLANNKIKSENLKNSKQPITLSKDKVTQPPNKTGGTRFSNNEIIDNMSSSGKRYTQVNKTFIEKILNIDDKIIIANKIKKEYYKELIKDFFSHNYK